MLNHGWSGLKNCTDFLKIKHNKLTLPLQSFKKLHPNFHNNKQHNPCIFYDSEHQCNPGNPHKSVIQITRAEKIFLNHGFKRLKYDTDFLKCRLHFNAVK